MVHPKSVPPPASSPDDIELQFYEALQRGDIELLMASWADDEDICCVHPGGPRLLGAAAIRGAFDSIFANGAVQVRPEKIRRVQTHTCAVHSVLEHIRVGTLQRAQEAWIIATNVYVLGAQGWRLVAHHASPGTARELQEQVEAASSVLH